MVAAMGLIEEVLSSLEKMVRAGDMECEYTVGFLRVSEGLLRRLESGAVKVGTRHYLYTEDGGARHLVVKLRDGVAEVVVIEHHLREGG